MILVIGISSCEEIKDELNTNFQVTLNMEFDNVDSSSYSGKKLLDLGDDKDFRQNKDRLKDVDISKITYKILLPVTAGTDTMSEGKIQFSTKDESAAPVTIAQITQPVLLKANNDDVELPIDAAAKAQLINLFKSEPYAAMGYYKATFNPGRKVKPATFKIQFKVYVDVKAGL